jgi:hypothetical protein
LPEVFLGLPAIGQHALEGRPAVEEIGADGCREQCADHHQAQAHHVAVGALALLGDLPGRVCLEARLQLANRQPHRYEALFPLLLVERHAFLQAAFEDQPDHLVADDDVLVPGRDDPLQKGPRLRVTEQRRLAFEQPLNFRLRRAGLLGVLELMVRVQRMQRVQEDAAHLLGLDQHAVNERVSFGEAVVQLVGVIRGSSQVGRDDPAQREDRDRHRREHGNRGVPPMRTCRTHFHHAGTLALPARPARRSGYFASPGSRPSIWSTFTVSSTSSART